MHTISGEFILFLTALVLGLRHGIDWDHLAAITDITGSSKNRRDGFMLASFYIIGHATVIVLFGVLAIAVGIHLPSVIDRIMEPVVGVTLILLGIWLLYSVVKHKEKFKMQSRWMLLFFLISKLYNFLHEKFAHKHELPHIHYPEEFGKKTATSVGILHGIGAETPTQVLLFVTAAGVKGGLTGLLLLATFVIGLMISNSIIALVGVLGYASAAKFSKVYLGLGIISGIFSTIVGILFLTGNTSFLPVIFGG